MPLQRVLFAIVAMAVVLGACASASTASVTASAEPTGELRILTPSNGDVVESATVTFAGTAPRGAAVVHDIPLGFDDEVQALDGTWTLDVELDEGVNEITLRLGDDEATAQTVRVTYRPSTAVASQAAAPTESPTPGPTPEPTAQPTPEPTPKPAKVEYKKLSDRSWKKVVKAPDDYIGRTYQVWACVSQFDAATGLDTFRGQASNKKREYWYTDGVNALFTGTVEGLADVVEDDVIVINALVLGSFSYDTQAGGNTTVPWFSIERITNKGSCE